MIKAGTVEYSAGGSSPASVKGLTNNQGDPLYIFTLDRRDHSLCTSRKCLAGFSPVLAPHGVTAKKGSGVNQKFLGTIRRAGNRRQVTFKHRPLYFFPPDRGGPLAFSEGCTAFGGVWYIIEPSGQVVKAVGCQGYP